MNFLHIADLHLGKKLNGYDLLEDQKAALREVLRILKEEKTDAVAITGDIYQSSVPSGQAMTLFSEFLTELSREGVPVFIISGNHDSEERVGYLSPLLTASDVHVAAPFEGTLQTFSLWDEEGEVVLHLLPFIKPVQVAALYPEETIESYEEAVKCVIRHSVIDTTKRNVLLCHQFITGAQEGGSEERIIGGSEEIPGGVFQKFDLVLMGHIHRSQTMRVGETVLTYAGSLLPYSVKEKAEEKSCSIVQLGSKGMLPEVVRHRYPLLRPVREVSGYLDDLLMLSPTRDLVSVVLLDEHLPMDYVASLRSVFEDLLEIRVPAWENTSWAGEMAWEAGVDNPGAAGGDGSEEGNRKRTEEKSELELFGDFYAWSQGRELPEEERELLESFLDTEGKGNIDNVQESAKENKRVLEDDMNRRLGKALNTEGNQEDSYATD